MPILPRDWKEKECRQGSGEEMIISDDLPNSERGRLIDEYIHSERNRELMKRRWIDGICFEPLAEEFDLSVRQVKYIVYRSEDIIFRHIN